MFSMRRGLEANNCVPVSLAPVDVSPAKCHRDAEFQLSGKDVSPCVCDFSVFVDNTRACPHQLLLEVGCHSAITPLTFFGNQ